MSIQIDILPIESVGFFKQNIYIKGCCYTSIISAYELDRMIEAKIVKQVKGYMRAENGSLIEFDYPKLTDSAGVRYTSIEFKIKHDE